LKVNMTDERNEPEDETDRDFINKNIKRLPRMQ
jgi:hypothetical protein